MAGLPDPRQIGRCSTLGQQRLQGLEATFAGQIGGEERIQVHHIGGCPREHRRQQFPLDRAPGNIGPNHVIAGVLLLPAGNDVVEVAIEFGGQIQGPKLDRLAVGGLAPRRGTGRKHAGHGHGRQQGARQTLWSPHPRAESSFRQRSSNSEQIRGASKAVIKA